MKDLIFNLFVKLDGRKTAIGLVLIVLGSILEKLIDPATGEAIADIGWGLTGIGALHKVVKGK